MTRDYDDIDELSPIEQFFDKLDWEGGGYEALEYGLKSDDYDIPPMMRVHWDQVREVFASVETALDDFDAKWRPGDA